MGYNRNTAIAVIRGPRELGGEGLFHLYDDQSYGQVKFFLKFWRSQGCTAGILLRIVMAWVQFCSGVSWFVLERPDIPYKHLEAQWIGSLLQYLKMIKATIQVFNPPIAKRQRINDVFIMDVVVQSGKFKPSEIRRINYCRLYLNVLLLSDIATAGGRAIDPAMYLGNKEETISKSKDHQAHQEKPTDPKAWEAWRKALRYFCHSQGARSMTLKSIVLGDWLFPWPKLRRHWPFMFDAEEEMVYWHKPTGWTKHRKLFSDFDQDPIGTVQEPPPMATPVDIKIRGTFTLQRGTYRTVQPVPPPPPTPISIMDMIDKMDEWEQHLLRDLVLLEPEPAIWTALTTMECIFVSDGSAPEPRGSFGWILSDPDGNRLAECSGPAFGIKPNSYRTEGYGMLSGHRFILRMHQIHQGQMRRHEFDTDSESMLKKVKKHLKYKKIFPNVTMGPEWDVIAEILATTKEMPRQIRPKLGYVRGHQDKSVEYSQLSLEAQLNVDADALADKWLRDHPEFDHSMVPVLPSSGCQINLQGGTLTGSLKEQLYRARAEPIMRKHLMKKYDWDEDTYNEVDWTSHGRALRRLEKNRKTLVKYLNNISPCGIVAHRNNPKYPEDCPSCGAPVEDQQHLIHCPKRKEDRETWFKAIKQYTEETTTPMPLQDLLLKVLRALLDDEDTDSIEGDQYTQEIVDVQRLIGWDQILKGRYSKQWAVLMDRHLGAARTHKNNGTSWVTGLSQRMLQQWLEVWAARNRDRHGSDYKTKAEATKRQAIREVTQLYDQFQGQVGAAHEWIFAQTPLLQRIQQTTTAMRQWINTWKQVLVEAYQTRLETG